MAQALRNLSIRAKLFVLSGTLIALIVATAVATTVSITNVHTLFADYRDTAQAQKVVANINEDFLEVRLAALKYRAQADAKFVADLKGNAEEIQDVTGNVARVLDDDATATLRTLADDVARYKAAFLDARQAGPQGMEQIFRTKLDVIGPRVAEAIDTISDDLAARQDARGTQAAGQLDTTRNRQIIVSMLAVLIGLGATGLLVRAITRPMARVTSAMAAIADGDRTQTVPETDRRDAIGQFARVTQQVRDSAVAQDRQAEAQRRDAEAKAERAARIERETAAFRDQVSRFMDTMASSAQELDATAQQMASAAEQTSQQTGRTASAARTSRANVDAVASAAEQVTNSIDGVNQNVARTREQAQVARQDAEGVSAEVGALNTAVANIGEVVTLINDIADQTNLLALNATIEAARAGDSGKGFAVVAGEVKALANQTRKATEDIQARIGDIQARSTAATAGIQATTAKIRDMDEMTTRVASAMEEQATALREIAQNIQEASQGTNAIADNVDGLRDATRTTSASAEQVSTTSKEVAQQGETLKRQIFTYIETVTNAAT
jgi:methyl-accepting chemotaxis protein